MGVDIVVRPLAQADKSALVDVYRETWRKTYAPVLTEAGMASMLASLDEKGVADIVPGNDERAYVAVVDGNVVGSAVFAERKGMAYLWGMYIHPDLQRFGVGTALIRYGAERLGDGAIIEAMVLKSSSWAISFYEKLGLQRGEEGEFELVPGEVVPFVRMGIRKKSLLERMGN